MKKVILIFCILFGLLFVGSLSAEDVIIGTQKWMPANLNVDHYQNGDPIPQVTDPNVWASLTTGAWCYYNNDPANGAIYGKLYNWYAVNDPRGLAPEGYHVSSDAEWTILTTYLGGEEVAGGKLKETGFAHWLSPNTGATNESGFTGLPGGYRWLDGSFQYIKDVTGFWTNTEQDATFAWGKYFVSYDDALGRYAQDKKDGRSVRCVKDAIPPVNEVIIGSQIWKTKNLDVAYYRNGDPIPQVTDSTQWANLTTGAWCYYNNDPANGEIYGKLYNWYAVNDPRGLAPEGYHIPSDEEWTKLTTFLGSENVAGGKLKETGFAHWQNPNTGANNEYGFTGLPGGYRENLNPSTFEDIDSTSCWWSSSEYTWQHAYYRCVVFNSEKIYPNYIYPKFCGFSVRCVKDAIPPLNEVIIGSQIWKTKNLDVAYYQNGDPIPQVTDPAQWINLTYGAWCYMDNDPSTEGTYGKLYNWHAINDKDHGGLAPEGWHVPSDDDWNILVNQLGGAEVAGGKMKESGYSHWSSPNEGATNESGFTGLPHHWRSWHEGNFYTPFNTGNWWSSTEYNSAFASYWAIRSEYANIAQVNSYKNYGFSVRIIKDVAPTLQDGLVAYYPFNSNAKDESGNGNHGTVNGATLTTDRFGYLGRTFSFDGVNDYIELPSGSNTTLNITGNFCVSFWFLTNVGSSEGMIGLGDNYATNGYLIALGNNNMGSGKITVMTGGNWYCTNQSSYADNNWHNIIVNLKNGYLQIFCDNILSYSTQNVNSPISFNGTRALGSRNDFSTGFLHGSIDDIRIYNRALSETEVAELFWSEAVVQLVSPENSSASQPRNVTLKWESLNLADSYQLEVSLNSNFTNIIAGANTTSTSYLNTNLSNDKTYYWRVRAKKGDIYTQWSEIWNFTTVTGSINLESGLVAHYPFTGGSTQDFSGNGNHGTKSGATPTADRFGNTDCAYNFDGVDDYIEVSHSSSLNVEEWSISAWYKTNANDNNLHRITTKQVFTGSSSNYLSIIMGNGNIYGSAWNGSSEIRAFDNSLTNDIKWHHVLYIRNLTTKKYYLYIDNMLRSISDDLYDILSNSASMSIGKAFNNSQYWIGEIDDIRIYNRSLSEAEVAALYNEGNVEPKQTPNLLCNAKVEQGTDLEIAVFNCTVNEPIKLNFSGIINYEFTANANSWKAYNFVINTDEITPGNYEVIAYDTKTGVYSNKKSVIINASDKIKELAIEHPTATSFKVDSKLRIIWNDYIAVVPGYNVVGPRREYHFKLYVKFGNGSWIPFAEDKVGLADKYTYKQFESSLILNSVQDEVRIRIVDVLQNNREIISPVFSIINKPEGFDVVKLWDKSLSTPPSNRLEEPNGVVADGISRIVLNVKKIDPERVIQSVKAEIIGNDMKTSGKLCWDVNYNNSYYDITEGQTPDLVKQINGDVNDYYFWYISPEDFVSNSTDKDNVDRTVQIKFTVTYDNSEEITVLPIIIKRTPLILVHGIADDKYGWSNFKTSKIGNGYSGYFNSDQRWISEVPSLMKFEPFAVNASIIKSQICHLIEKTLIEGFAANQVDYVCHSMGGSVLRTFEEANEDPNNLHFYDDNVFRTYSKGFIHKFITLNTPHNGTPIADVLVGEILPYLNSDQVISDIAAGLHANAIANGGFSFLETIENRTLERPWYKGGDKQVWYATPALYNLLENPVKVDGKFTETIRHKKTNLKSHLIAGDVISGYQNLPDVPQSVWNLVNINDYIIDVIDKYLNWKLNWATKVTGWFGGDLYKIYKTVNKVERVFKYLNYLVKGYATIDYFVDSDIIVPLKSQIPDLVSNSKIFEDWKYWHSSVEYKGFKYEGIRDQSDVGDYVFDLLHEPLSSTKFDIIPASPAVTQSIVKQQNEQEQQENNLPAFTTLPTLTVFTPNDSISVNPDSLMNISFSVSSTDGLFLKKIYFHDITLVDTTLYDYANYDVLVSGSNLGKQNLSIMAFYVFSDTSFVLTKNLVVYVNPVENPIELIAEPEMNYLKINEMKYINTKSIFKNFITDVSQSDSLKISIGDTNIVKYQNNKFVGKSEGMTSVEFSYMGTRDSVWFEVNGILPIPDTIPTLLYPQNLSNDIVLTDTLKWSNPANTNFINIQVATDSMFTQFVYTNTIFNDSVSVMNNLEKMKNYYWRVKAVGLGGESEWSETWSFNTEPEKQNILLQTGWNLISSYIIPQEPDSMQYVCNDVKSNMTLAKNGAGKTFIPAYNINQIGKWNYKQGYQVYMTKTDTLTVAGLMSDPINDAIDLAQGWNMAAYLRSTPMNAPVALASIVGNNKLLLAKNNKGKTFIPQYGINQIGNLMPGEGYQLYMQTASQLTYPANELGKSSIAYRTPNPKYLIPKYEVTGNSAVVLISVTAPDGNEIGIYNQNDELIGSGVVQNNIASVTIWGDDEQTEITDGAVLNSELRMMNYELKSGRLSDVDILGFEDFITGEMVSGLTYSKDAVYFAKAGIIQNSTNISLNVRPNPASDIIEIEFTTPDCKATNLSIYSIDGKLISNLSGKLHDLESNLITHDISNFSSGEYTIILTCENERAMRKVVVVK